MEVNKEEALRCLTIAQKHRNASNLPSALKFAKKSVSLFTTPEGEKMVSIIESEIDISVSGSTSTSASGAGSGSSTPAAGMNGSSGNAEAGPSSGKTKAKASGVEEHVSEARQRPGHAAKPAGTSAKAEGKKREYTVKQVEVVKRIKSCQGHQYYEILSVEKSCTENDIKKAYKKLALALHPDKNGAPGADEAFKMVSKAFQILSDPNLRAAFDNNPHSDPTQRGGGGGGGGGGFSGFNRGGGMHPGFGGGGGGMYTEINPEDLFNAFFGGGMGGFGGGGGMGNGPFGGNVFTFGGPSGFSSGGPGARARNAAAAAAARGGAGRGGGGGEQNPLIALLPIFLLLAFGLLSSLPSLLGFSSGDPDPAYAFTQTERYDMGRDTWHWGVRYWVNKEEWGKSGMLGSIPEGSRGVMDLEGVQGLATGGVNGESSAVGGETVKEGVEGGKKAMGKTTLPGVGNTEKKQRGGGVYSTKVRTWEKGIENIYAQKLRNECDYFTATIERQIQNEAGFFGIGADHAKIRDLRSRRNPACEQLKAWGVSRAQSQNFY